MKAIASRRVMGSLLIFTWAFVACGGDAGETGNNGSGASGGTGGSGEGATGAVLVTGGTEGSSGGSSNQGSGAGSNVDECAKTTQKADPTPANLLFVIDKSGSMNCNPPDGDAELGAKCANFPVKEFPEEPSKWEVTSDALSNALDSLAEMPNVRAGVTLFPTDSACGVTADPDIDIASLDEDEREQIAELLSGVEPSGETPLAGATILSYQHLDERLEAANLKGNHFVVLLTDGAETCKEAELPKLVSEDVPNARLLNIRTFVIGAPGSEQARARLSQMAWEGGTASSKDCNHSDDEADEGDCHFDMTTSTDFATDLNNALKEIAQTKILSCEFDVPKNESGGGVDLGKVNVTFTSGDGEEEEVLKDASESCEDAMGWQYSSDFSKIVLCGEICDRVKADSEGQVDIVLGCPTVSVK
jgi:hypothetical protein